MEESSETFLDRKYCPHIGLTSAFVGSWTSINNNELSGSAASSTTNLLSTSSSSSSSPSISAPAPLDSLPDDLPAEGNEHEAIPFGDSAGGDGDTLESLVVEVSEAVKSVHKSKKRSASSSKRKAIRVCSLCQGGRTKTNLWKCLALDCGLVFCGAAGNNHAEDHFQENPDHVIQLNLSSKRIWCNACHCEVFDDHRNRRLAPAIWVPPMNPESEPPRGLYNIGNTCFMNAALQNILAVLPLTSYFMGDVFKFDGIDDTRNRRVAVSYRWLLNELAAEPRGPYVKSIMPSRLLYAVRTAHPIFRGFQQHDSQEFLRLFMDSLAEDTKVPHFHFEERRNKNKANLEEGSENESETESFETCDSGNGSEETMSTETEAPKPEDEEAMDCAESEPSRSIKITMKSILADIFDGQVESSVQCLSCHETSRHMEVFQDLSLPIPTRDELQALHLTAGKYVTEEGEGSAGWMSWILDWVKSFFWGPSPSLEDCFSAFFSSDELKGKNMYSCEKCGRLRNGLKRCTLYHLPEILCVHLKRFRMYEYPTGMGYSSKVNQYVQFPIDGLDVRPFLHKDCPSGVSNYKLMGVICHIGSVMGGHYTAYIRKGDTWFLADDCRVVPVSVEQVLECEAYVLFYQKWDVEEDETKKELLRAWGEVDQGSVPNSRFHLISRKWLTQFFWGEEAIPLDNSDVVCPHGHRVPTDNLQSGATWIPHTVWDMIISKYGGGPDLKYYEVCTICSIAWKKHQRTHVQRPSSRATSFGEVSTSTDSYFTSNNSSCLSKSVHGVSLLESSEGE